MSPDQVNETIVDPINGAGVGPNLRSLADEVKGTERPLDDTRYLKASDLAEFVKLATEGAETRGADYFAWRNAPTVKGEAISVTSGWGDTAKTETITPQQALDIYEAKVNGAYSERWLLAAAYIVHAVKEGQRVALLQIAHEPGVPFDASGWVVVSVNGYPMFHVSPQDLPLQKLADAKLVTMVTEGSERAKLHGWKNTNKVDEYGLLLRWALDPREAPTS